MDTRTYAKLEAAAKYWTDLDMDAADFRAHRDELEKIIDARVWGAYIEDAREADAEAMIDRLTEQAR